MAKEVFLCVCDDGNGPYVGEGGNIEKAYQALCDVNGAEPRVEDCDFYRATKINVEKRLILMEK